jgi:outer membrane lipoprotein LolB
MNTSLPLAGVLLALLLTACAGQPPRPAGDASWEEHSNRLLALTNWTAEGKLALRTPELSESATMSWRQQDGHTRLELSGPLGVNATTLDSDGKTLLLRQGDETSSVDLSDPLELERRTGWDLPLLALPHWLKGLPAPGLAIEDMAMGPDPSLLQSLQQDGWQIRYDQYQDFDRLALPTRLHIQRERTSVRLIIRHWQAEPTQ